MQYTGQFRSESAGGRAENEHLREEIEELRRELQKHKEAGAPGGQPGHARPAPWRPSGLTILAILVVLTAGFALAFFAGYMPLVKRNSLIRAEASDQAHALPRVEVVMVERSTPGSLLRLPGSIQAVTEAPVLARADGYLLRRMVDIGDRVKAGQPLAEIAAPEVDQQILQAKAVLQQAQANLEQAQANYDQGRSNMELARVTAERWSRVAANGGVSKQENDQYQAQFRAQSANVQSLEKAVGAQRSNIAAAEANLARLDEVQGYRIVKAPFAGVITLRNVDVGALVNSSSTLLFRIAQTETMRTYVNVPQTNASAIKPGQLAVITVSNLPGRKFRGSVARMSDALDPASRTMLVEVQVPNSDGALLPGTYAQVELSSPGVSATAPLVIPGDALVVRATGAQVALVKQNHRVHFQKIEVGRDFGDRLEVINGLTEGDAIIPNPSDVVREGVEVDPVHRAVKGSGK